MSTPASTAADLLRVLGDETRLQMLALLRRREFCVCELVALFPVSQPAVSGHLRRLKDAGLVDGERRGMWVYYRAAETVPALVDAVLGEVVLPAALQVRLQRPEPADGCETAPSAVMAAMRPRRRHGTPAARQGAAGHAQRRRPS